MSKSAFNLIILLGIVAVLIGGYFMFGQAGSSTEEQAKSARQLEQLVSSSELFVERSRALAQIQLDTSIFESDTFNALKSYSPDLNEFRVGRSNPFAAPTQSSPLPVDTESGQ